GLQAVALAQLTQQPNILIRDHVVHFEGLAGLPHAAPGDGEVDLAAGEAVLDQLADLIFERAHQLGGADRDLAEAVGDRAHLGRKALAVALDLGRTVPRHAADHPYPLKDRAA